MEESQPVLILIVVEERIGYSYIYDYVTDNECLNPYCSGRKNRIFGSEFFALWLKVLILIVVEERIGFSHLGMYYLGSHES